MSKVSIITCNSYDLEKVEEAIDLAVEQTAFPDVKGKTVLLKPNVLSDSPKEKNVTTHPVVVQATIRLLRKKGAKKIFVGDSPGLQGANFKPIKSGMLDVCEIEGVAWVDFTKETVVKKLPIVDHKLKFAKIIDQVDLSISLSKFKTHEFMYATGSVKNMFGLIPSTKKSAQHLRHPSRNSFAKMICGLMHYAKVEYTIMDAIEGMEGAGPANGTTRKVGKIIAGADPFAVDIAQATIMGYDPMKLPIIACGIENNLTDISKIEDIEYPLIDPRRIIMKDYKRVGDNTSTGATEETEYLNRPSPEFDEKTCILCKKCMDICPANALNLEDKKIHICVEKCIRCYCCHEVCPVNAISIEH